MLIGKTYEGFEVKFNLEEKINSNNLMLCLGDSGNGKTTLLKNLARGAIDDGVSVIIPDTSESYLEADIKEWKNTEYYNVILTGLPINVFKHRTVKYDSVEFVESDVNVASRITDVLLNSFEITGAVQGPVLAEAVRKHLCGSTINKSFKGILSELHSMDEPQAKILELKLRALLDVPEAVEHIDWDDIVKNKKIVIFQLSYLSTQLRALYMELIMADFWDWVRKRKSKEDVFLVLDEVSNFSFKSPFFMSGLREFRKFGIGAVMATQFMGGLKGKEAMNLLGQAAIKMYFGIQDIKEATRIAKDLDYLNYKKWVPVIKGLARGECVFCGKILYSGASLEQKVVVKVPYKK